MTDEQLHHAHRLMTTSRLFDDMAVSLQRQGRINIHAPTRGQEAASTGSAMALDPARDWIAPQYREFPAYLHHGMPLVALWTSRLGVGLLDTVPESVRMLPVQIAIAAQIPQAMGIAWGMSLQGNDGVVIAYFGDGASSEGDFHEAANFAGVMRAPLILFCQSNGWAISTPRSRQSAAESLADRAVGYGMPGIRVDGNDLLAVHEVTGEAVRRARAGEGPTLIEAVTYRAGMHNTADDPARYMGEDQGALTELNDPLTRLRQHLHTRGLLDQDTIAALEREVVEELESTLKLAEQIAAEADPVGVIFDHVFAEPPRSQMRQRDEAELWASHA